MRIAIISTVQGYSWAGTEEVWFHFARRALQAGHSVMLGADWQIAASAQVDELRDEGMEVVSRKAFRPVRLFLLKQKFLPDMRRIRSFKPDILLINSGSPLDHVYLRYLWDFIRELNCPQVYYCHFNSDRQQIADREALRRDFEEMDGLVFVSEANRSLLQRQLAWKSPKSLVIPNASRLGLESPCPWPELPVRFAHVARLETAWKGHDLLLECLAQYKWLQRDWTLTLFGSGPDESYIRDLIAFYGLQKRVLMGGYVRDMVEVYRDHHALLLPSRGEGMPLVALEAMMCGRPVIATDVGGNSELIEDGTSGFIAEAPTPHSFDRALERAWNRRTEWELMGQAAHEKARLLNRADPPGRLLEFLESLLPS